MIQLLIYLIYFYNYNMDRSDEEKSFKKKTKKHIIRYKVNPSGSLLIEEHLNKCLAKTSGIPLKNLRSTFAPRNKHSPFGDFPNEFLPKKNEDFEPINIENHQVAYNVSNLGATNGMNLAASTTMTAGGKLNKTTTVKNTAFTSLRHDTKDKPPRAGALNPRKIPVSDFRLRYDRGDLPVLVQHSNGTKIKWKEDVNFDKFNYQHYLPIFVDGIREKVEPYRFLAIEGTFELLKNVKDVVVKVIPQLIIPLKTALNTRDPDIILVALKVIQQLVKSSELAGEALVPYYRQLLPIFNLYKDHNVNLGDHFDYSQRKKKNLGDVIQETLEVMEVNGGDVSFFIYF